jgi:hypothetical protein
VADEIAEILSHLIGCSDQRTGEVIYSRRAHFSLSGQKGPGHTREFLAARDKMVVYRRTALLILGKINTSN